MEPGKEEQRAKTRKMVKKNATKEEREHIETKKDSIVFGQAFIGRMNEEGDMDQRRC